ncbi:MAG: hypothetical protein R3D30_10480 [Hyphomicrobiales bacterium]
MQPETAPPVDCKLAENHYQTARASYETGDASAFKTGLIQAEQAMASLPAGACGDLSQNIAKGHEQADVLSKINATAGELLSSCKGSDPRTRAGQMRELAGLLSKTKQPYVQQLVRRLDAAQQAALTYADIKDAFANADLDTSWRKLELARGTLGALGEGDCPDLREAIEKTPRVLSHWRDQVDTAERLMRGCDVDAMERERVRLAAIGSPIAGTLSTRVGTALSACKAETAQKGGEENTGGSSCKAGYNPGPKAADGSFYCIPTQATANAWCASNAGSGYYAVNIKSDGSHRCMPTKSKANADCQKANPGRKGIYGQINADGSVACKQTTTASKSETIAAANAACQRSNNNRNARASKYLGNGQWSCYIPGQQKTVTRRRNQPSVSAQDIARGAAAIGAIINQMQQSGGGRHRGHTDFPTNPDLCTYKGRRTC